MNLLAGKWFGKLPEGGLALDQKGANRIVSLEWTMDNSLVEVRRTDGKVSFRRLGFTSPMTSFCSITACLLVGESLPR